MPPPSTPTAVKGMRDLLPADTRWFERLEQAARELFAVYNYGEIRTPLLEPTGLFARSVGEASDIVNKEMYTFEDRDGASVTLRPEATASTVRAYIEHRLWEQPGVTRLYYAGPMFRRERPQKGRYRQFFQIGAELLGGDEPEWDFELIELLVLLLERCGIAGAELVLNSVGCAQCRPGYDAALRLALAPRLAAMCADCQRRAAQNPLRVFDCKVEADQETIGRLPLLADFLDDACRAHFAAVRRLLELGGIAYRLDPRMVRGLDYYVRTTFEFLHGALGAQNALLGGGRYDGLARALGAKLPPGVSDGGIGFALGEDRFVLAMQAQAAPPLPAPLSVLVPLSGAEQPAALALARRLRLSGARLELAPPARKLGKTLELAARRGAAFALLLGPEEAAAGTVQLKELSSGAQQAVAVDGLASRLREALP